MILSVYQTIKEKKQSEGRADFSNSGKSSESGQDKNQNYGIISYKDQSGRLYNHRWTKYIRIGLAAETRYILENSGSILSFINHYASGLALLLGISRVLLRKQFVKMMAHFDHESPKDVLIDNIVITIINPGQNSYQWPEKSDSGFMYVSLWQRIPLMQKVYLTWMISRNNIMKLSPQGFYKIKNMALKSEHLFCVAYDHEIIWTNRVVICGSLND